MRSPNPQHPKPNTLVYDSASEQPGRCTTCRKRLDRCTCGRPSQKQAADHSKINLPRDGIVRILRDRKGRGGKTVTLIAGLPGSPDQLAELVAELKRTCGTGGTVRGNILELQGDFRDRLVAELKRRGYTVKLAGG